MVIPKKWLITGGCGFIGTNLIKKLILKDGLSIRIVDNLSVGSIEDLEKVCKFIELDSTSLNLKSTTSSPLSCSKLSSEPNCPVELIRGDILDGKLALKAAEGMEVIVHLAASTGVSTSVENPMVDCMTNVIGTLIYLEAARLNGIGKFITASSAAAVGEGDPPFHEEMAPHPVSPYGAGKLAGEAYCSAYFSAFGINTIALRFSNVYGPGSDHKNSVVAKFIKQAIDGQQLEVYGDGNQTRDFIYIEDLIQAIYLAATLDKIGGEIFQIATNTETTVNNLVDMLVPILAEAGFHDVKVHNKPSRAGDVMRNFSDISKAEKMMGWMANMELSDGLKRTMKWFTGSKV